MSKVLRRKMVDELAEKLRGQRNLVLVNPQGLTANQAVELRAQLRDVKVSLKMVKNSVALHALKKLGVEAGDQYFTGMSAFVYGADPLALAKKLSAYQEKHQKPGVKFVLIEGKAADAAMLSALAKLPGREAILASFIGMLNAVTQKFVSTLNEVPRSFVGVLQAVSEKK